MDDLPTNTIQEYVQLEKYSNLKHEYDDGQIRAMSGGTIEHARLASAILRLLGNQLVGRPCAAYTSDARVRVAGVIDLITYPDVSVGCGPIEMDTDDPFAQKNPTVLVEVTSTSSERYDRGRKFELYKRIASLREYVIVSHREHAIEVFRRGADGEWTVTRSGPGETARLESIGCELEVDTVYRDPRATSS